MLSAGVRLGRTTPASAGALPLSSGCQWLPVAGAVAHWQPASLGEPRWAGDTAAECQRLPVSESLPDSESELEAAALAAPRQRTQRTRVAGPGKLWASSLAGTTY
jgi:hypothetical protein